jgi:putative FmdB family regulatory protein
MPFYEYQCSACGAQVEVLQKITDAPLKKCPECGKARMAKLVSAPVFRLKGGGWYETDFKSDKDKKRNLVDSDGGKEAGADKAADKPVEKPAEKEKSADKPDSKPAAKAESASGGSERKSARRVAKPAPKSPARRPAAKTARGKAKR